MSRKIRISIVTVCYNSHHSIERTIQSVLRQTYDDIEYIIMDGGSTDGTVDIIEKYSSDIIWSSENDNGIYDAMNKAMAVATGDYLLFLGSDDVLYSDETIGKICVELTHPDDVYYGNVIITGKGRISTGRFNRYKMAVVNICHQAILYPRSVYRERRYDLRFTVYADYAYNLALIGSSIRFRYVNTIVSVYNTEGFSLYTVDQAWQEAKPVIVRETLGYGPFLLLKFYSAYRRMIRHLFRL